MKKSHAVLLAVVLTPIAMVLAIKIASVFEWFLKLLGVLVAETWVGTALVLFAGLMLAASIAERK